MTNKQKLAKELAEKMVNIWVECGDCKPENRDKMVSSVYGDKIRYCTVEEIKFDIEHYGEEREAKKEAEKKSNYECQNDFSQRNKWFDTPCGYQKNISCIDPQPEARKHLEREKELKEDFGREDYSKMIAYIAKLEIELEKYEK